MTSELEDLQRSFLSILVAYPERVPLVLPIIGDKQVFSGKWQAVYDTIIALWAKGELVDVVTVSNSLKKYQDDVFSLALGQAAPSGVETYAKLLVERYLLKSLEEFGRELTHRAKKPEDPFSLLEYAESKVFKFGSSIAKRDYVPIEKAVDAAIARIEHIHTYGPVGIPTGVERLDQLLLGGWQREDLAIIAGRPSQGKTAFVLFSATAAAKSSTPVGIFSVEMGASALVTRMLSSEAGVPGDRLKLGIMSETERGRIRQAKDRVGALPIYIEDSGSISVTELRARARKLVAERGVGLLIVDYIQLLYGGKDHGTREQEVAFISRVLKSAAKELALPVLAVSQLSRAMELRAERRPQLSDLRESGAIEQDADVVAFLYENQGQTTISVAKQRNGPLDDIGVNFDRKTGRFT